MKKLLIIILAGIIACYLCLFFGWFPITKAQKNNAHTITSKNHVEGEILIKFRDNVDLNLNLNNSKIQTGVQNLDKIFEENGFYNFQKVFKNDKESNKNNIIKIAGNSVPAPKLHNIYKFEYNSSRDISSIIDRLDDDPLIEFAEPNYYFYSNSTFPNDPLYQNGNQWYIDAVHAPEAWDSTVGDTNQVIAILDTGIDWDHPDLDGNIWRNWDEMPNNGIDDDNNGYTDDIRGWDYINNDNNPNDDNSHGTHVAGIAGAESNNATGICGVVWDVRLMAVKILQSSGFGTAGHLAAGINYAANNGATVINMSLGSYAESLTVKNALENAYSNCALVAAAGNDEYAISFMRMFPACYPFVLGVQASDQSGSKASFSNFDDSGPYNTGEFEGYANYEIYAPGVNILSTFPYGIYHYLNGTSMSAPIVSGAVALLKSYYPIITAEEIFARLIQGSNGGNLNIYNSLTINLVPILRFVNYTILDTVAGCDHDGKIDAGETIEIKIEVQNVGGWADSVYASAYLQDIQDTAKVQMIIQNSYIGDLSTYANLTNHPLLRLKFKNSIPHNDSIPIGIHISGKNCEAMQTSVPCMIVNAEELIGIYDTIVTLTPDKFWLINNDDFKILSNGGIKLLPGTHLKIEVGYINWGTSYGHGTPDSLIYIEGPCGIGGNPKDFTYTKFFQSNAWGDGQMNNCVFENCNNPINGDSEVEDCLFKNCHFTCIFGDGTGQIKKCNFINFSGVVNSHGYLGSTYNYNNFSGYLEPGPYITSYGGTQLGPNNFITGPDKMIYGTPPTPGDVIYLPPLYWGTTNNEIIDELIVDFWDNPAGSICYYQPVLTAPTDSAHGIVWKVELNGIDPQDEYLEPIGSEKVKFDVFFNRPMDTAYAPLLTFGNYSPYTEHTLTDSSSWNVTSTIWTAYFDVGQETGDGINTIKVSGARDLDGWEVPPEFNNRFKFIIQAASAASIEFIATAGLDKVSLEWPKANTNDLLGYNLYRFNKINDSTYTSPVKINYDLITDTVFTDGQVLGGIEYTYYYKIIGTDLQESDKSKNASATPYHAPPGDANGDLTINVLDITTVIAYILNQQPQPFIFYAADANNDLLINVLDVVKIVELISMSKAAPYPDLFDSEEAKATLNEDILSLSTNKNISALQFEFTGENIDQVELSLLLKGFELSYATIEDTLRGLIYKFDNKTLPTGIFDVLKIQSTNPYYSLTKIFGADNCANYVPIIISNKEFRYPFIYFEASPNPFSDIVYFKYVLPEASTIDITMYNLFGGILYSSQKTVEKAGSYTEIWNLNSIIDLTSNTNLIICNFKAKPLNTNQTDYSLSTKMIYLKK